MANTDRRYAIQDIENQGADRSFEGFPMRETVGYDGIALQRSLADSMAIKITEVGDVTYIALAAPGTAQATAKWQVRKLDQTTGIIITFAGGTANFDQVATDLTTLSYS